MLLGIVEKRENSFIQAVNEMSFVIPFHGHHVEGRGGPELQPPRLHWLRQGCCWLHLFLFFFFLEEGEMFKSITMRPPLPQWGSRRASLPPHPAQKAAPRPDSSHPFPISARASAAVSGFH